jgi:hypothetical protein
VSRSEQPRLEDTDLLRVELDRDDETGEKVVRTWSYTRGEYVELKRWSP